MKTNIIYNEDCIKGLKEIPNNSIDCIITDPPYGDNSAYGRDNKQIEGNENPLLNCDVLFKFYHILKKGGTVYNFTNWKHYPFLANFIQQYTQFKIRMLLVICKNNIGMGYGFRNQYELCLVLEKGDCNYKLNNFSNLVNMDNINHNDSTHPHQKGINMLIRMIEHSTNKGDLILDPFIGSGSTAIACIKTGRKFIGFEIDEKWFNIANKKVEHLKGQNNLSEFIQ